MDIRIQNLESDCFYHIYNRGVDNNIIFSEPKQLYVFYETVFKVFDWCK
jgi:putative transposase